MLLEVIKLLLSEDLERDDGTVLCHYDVRDEERQVMRADLIDIRVEDHGDDVEISLSGSLGVFQFPAVCEKIEMLTGPMEGKTSPKSV